MNESRDSIMRMARGAFEERVDYEMDKVIQNILDPNTKATAKRKITLTIELTPDEDRRLIQVNVTAKSTIASTNPVSTSLYVTGDGNGETVVDEPVLYFYNPAIVESEWYESQIFVIEVGGHRFFAERSAAQ